MNPAKILAAALTITASIALTPDAAAATPGTCTITAQPWDGRSYALAAVVDGQPVNLITKQHGLLEGPTSFTFTTPSGVVGDLTGVTEVWWAARNPAKQATAADFYDVLHVNPDCSFGGGYKALPGKQDSVTIRVATLPTVDTTTTQPAPTTTTSTAPEPTTTTSTTVDLPPTTTVDLPPTTTSPPPIEEIRYTPEPPSSTTSEVTTTTAPPVVDVPLVEQPTTTTAPTPEVPSSSTAVVDVDLYTATSVERQAGTLPVTGANLRAALTLGGCLVALGGVLAAVFTPHRRRLARERAQ